MATSFKNKKKKKKKTSVYYIGPRPRTSIKHVSSASTLNEFLGCVKIGPHLTAELEGQSAHANFPVFYKYPYISHPLFAELIISQAFFLDCYFISSLRPLSSFSLFSFSCCQHADRTRPSPDAYTSTCMGW